VLPRSASQSACPALCPCRYPVLPLEPGRQSEQDELWQSGFLNGDECWSGIPAPSEKWRSLIPVKTALNRLEAQDRRRSYCVQQIQLCTSESPTRARLHPAEAGEEDEKLCEPLRSLPEPW